MRLTDCLDGLGSSVAYFPKLVKLVGGFQPTLFLCQMYYWLGKQEDSKGWIYKSREEIEKETGLTRYQQELARKKLRELGLIQERKRGLPRRLEFWLDVERLKECWEAFLSGVKTDWAEIKKKWKRAKEDPANAEVPDEITDLEVSEESVNDDTEIPQSIETVEEALVQEEEEFPPPLVIETTTPQPIQPADEDKPPVVPFEKIEQTKKPAAKTDKFFGRSKYDIWAEKQHPALVYAADETPWLDQPSRVQNVRFVRDFLAWGGKEFSKFQGTGDMAKSIADFYSAMKNDPDKILVRWEQYQSQVSKQQVLFASENEDWRVDAERQDEERRRQEEARRQATAPTLPRLNDRVAALAKAAQLRRSRTHA